MNYPVVLLLSLCALGSVRSQENEIAKLNRRLVKQEQEISSLKESIKTLTGKVEELTANNKAQMALITELLNRTPPQSLGTTSRVSSVTGTIYLSKNSGDSVLLRGVNVILCKASAITRWREIMRTKYYDTKLDPWGPSQFELDLMKFTQGINTDSVLADRTDVDGKFQFSDLVPGDYVIFVPYTTGSFAVAWIIECNVRNGESKKLELNNSNAKVLINK